MSKLSVYLYCIWCQANKSFAALHCLNALGSTAVVNAGTGGISGQFKHSTQRPEPLKVLADPFSSFLPLVCLRNTFPNSFSDKYILMKLLHGKGPFLGLQPNTVNELRQECEAHVTESFERGLSSWPGLTHHHPHQLLHSESEQRKCDEIIPVNCHWSNWKYIFRCQSDSSDSLMSFLPLVYFLWKWDFTFDVTEPSPPPLCVLIGPFLLGPMRDSDKPGLAAEGLPEPSALRTDRHPWP